MIVKRCKNKECNKVLPIGYKNQYCESCMNKQAHGVKKFLGGASAVLGVALLVITGGRFGGKK